MDRGIIYAAVAIAGVIIGALAFTYNPGVEVKTQTKVITTTITETPVTVTGQLTATASTTPTLKIQYNEQLAEKGVELFKEIGCNACHTVKSAGIDVGGNIGPDLSKALLGSVGVEGGTAGGPILSKYFEKYGLKDPTANLTKAAELLTQFLINGDSSLAPTMTTQIEAFKKQYGDKWAQEYVPALVEMLKMAAAKSS